jgi:dTDP-4-amino-4,6-dideoxygalactose transaminase
MPSQPPIYVTRPYLPPLEEFIPYLRQIWENKQLTNNGPFHQQLEQALCDYLGVEYISLFTNGTIALVTALQALRITGEVITTPYSFVATTHALHWNGIKPVFVDIDPATCNLDPACIEAAITPQTTAILPVHCYGFACDVSAIGQIADTYGLKVIYDAAHAFGVRHEGGSLLCHGDLSVLSFHATKVFHTFEGGAIICPDVKTKQRIDRLKNFGFADEVTVVAPGINGKMSEINSAFGLLQLQHIEGSLVRRRALADYYRDRLADLPGISVLSTGAPGRDSASYFPVMIEYDFPVSRDTLYEDLRAVGINGRRYFYPLISQFPTYRGLPSASPNNLPHATEVARKIICLPLYSELQEAEVDAIAQHLGSYQGSGKRNLAP